MSATVEGPSSRKQGGSKGAQAINKKQTSLEMAWIPGAVAPIQAEPLHNSSHSFASDALGVFETVFNESKNII